MEKNQLSFEKSWRCRVSRGAPCALKRQCSRAISIRTSYRACDDNSQAQATPPGGGSHIRITVPQLFDGRPLACVDRSIMSAAETGRDPAPSGGDHLGSLPKHSFGSEEGTYTRYPPPKKNLPFRQFHWYLQ